MPFDGTGYERRIQVLDKMDKVIGLLSDERHWCKRRLRTPEERYCILGAIMEAEAEAELKAPILLAIKQVTGRDHLRIEMFNDSSQTTHALVVKVLLQARENILADRPSIKDEHVGVWATLFEIFG